LEKLGTNLSAVVNMMIKQIIITESIPFEIKMNHSVYSPLEAIREVEARKISGNGLRQQILDGVK